MFAASKTASVSGGYQISRSLRFNVPDSTNLNRTFASAGNRQTWTYSSWVKRSGLSTSDEGSIFSAGATDGAVIRFETANTLRLYDYSGGFSFNLITTQVFRDASAWYHIVLTYDSTQATASNRTKLYVNGSQVTTFSTAVYPTLNQNTYFFNNNVTHRIGNHAWDFIKFYAGYMTEVNFIDGQALTPSSFGETNAQTGVWQPKAYSGSYGTNGFYLNFSDNSNTTAATLGKDYSGNGNNWTPNNFSVTAGSGNDSLVDSPTSYGTDTGAGGEVRGNYSTLNPLNISGTLANGNLDYTGPGSFGISSATIGMSSGKWYFEMTATSTGLGCGVSLNSASLTQYLGQNASGWAYFSDGNKYTNNSGSSYGATFTTGDVIGVAFDADAGTLVFYKNGTSQGTAFSSLTSGPYFFTVSDGSSPEQRTCTTNFGQRPFAYTAPSGFKALCTQNLPTPTIGATTATQAGKFFAPTIYTGNGASPRAVTGVGFQPDLVWMKCRSSAFVNGLFDSVRGTGKLLISNLTVAEIANDPDGYLSSFDSDGFSLTTGSSSNNTFNGNTSTYVAWGWKANGSGSTNTAGSITSTVSANTTSGFSVVTWTAGSGAGTVGHGLGATPQMIITKIRSTVDDWYVYHQDIGNTKTLFLDTTNGQLTTTVWNNTSPTSSVFTYFGSNTQTYVAYCFAEVAGYSKFGIYSGNSSADGPFVYCGFRPAYVMVKCSNTAGYNWIVFDNKRSGFNVNNDQLYPNLSAAEDAGGSGAQFIDLLSNGFKLRNTAADKNAVGGSYIFAAFAEAPTKFSLAR
jgi:hypothetical protein